jgi:hypothetical protein
MKKLLWLIPLLLLIFGFVNRDTVLAKTNQILYQSPCDTPKAYNIGSIDPRFQMSEDELAGVINESAAIWSSAYGKPLFTYDPQAKFTIDLVYDDRQSLNKEINQLNNELKQKDNALKPEIEAYKKRSLDLKARIESLNQEIQSWNEKGGAPADEYERLVARQKQLKQESEELNALARSLSLTTEDYNAKVKELDQTVTTYNDALNYKPEGGKYMLDATGEKIEIYIYDSRQELENVMAHELGHSLGMDHSDDTEAIMFAKSNNAITPTAADISLLRAACQKKNVIFMKYREFGYALQQTLNRYIEK